MNSTSLDNLIKTGEAILPDKLTKYLRKHSHITDKGKEAIQCSQYMPRMVTRPAVWIVGSPSKPTLLKHEALPKEVLKPPLQPQQLGSKKKKIYI